jgi:hypothetical protein
LKIAAVFNLTLPGEHPYCGDGLGTSGFPYDPEKDFMAEKIQFFNFGWEDMTVPTLPFMLDIVKVMASVLQDGHLKISVHCHAGYGRTGLAIACCLIFMHNIPPDRAIAIVRRDRPGSIQTSEQVKFVSNFHEYINEAKVVFPIPCVHDRFTIADMMEHQNRALHGPAFQGARSGIPRILDFFCGEIEKLATEANTPQLVQSFIAHLPAHKLNQNSEISILQDVHTKLMLGPGYNAGTLALFANPPRQLTSEELFPIKMALNVGEWNWPNAADMCTAIGFFPALLLDWLEHLAQPLLKSEIIYHALAFRETKELLRHNNGDSTVSMDISAFPVGSIHPHSPPLSPSRSTKWKDLNLLPTNVLKSLERVINCLRVLQYILSGNSSPRQLQEHESSAKKESNLSTIKTTARSQTFFHGICTRTAASLFQLEVTSSQADVLNSHGEFMKLLVREWSAPKRLELNIESLQKLGKSPSNSRIPVPPSGEPTSRTRTGKQSSTPVSSSNSTTIGNEISAGAGLNVVSPLTIPPLGHSGSSSSLTGATTSSSSGTRGTPTSSSASTPRPPSEPKRESGEDNQHCNTESSLSIPAANHEKGSNSKNNSFRSNSPLTVTVANSNTSSISSNSSSKTNCLGPSITSLPSLRGGDRYRHRAVPNTNSADAK